MTDRLTPLDVSFLYLEDQRSAMHVGSVMIFDPGPAGLDYEDLVRHVEARIAFVPRYRQRVRTVPGHLANPVWADYEAFDIADHVRLVTLAAPGDPEQLEDLVARIQSRRLDRRRPLWELAVVEGLADGRFAVITKAHQALVDGRHALDLGHVVLDEDPHVREHPPQTWHPAREPSIGELVVGAIAESVTRPTRIVETLRAGLGDVRRTASKATEAVGGLAVAARIAANPPPRSPLNVESGVERRFHLVDTDLDDYRAIRSSLVAKATGEGPVTSVNDVVLAVVAGALRSWLLARGEPVPPTSMVRALVPFSVKPSGHETDAAAAPALGGRVSSLLVDLPTGEGNPLIRVYQVSYQTLAHREAGQAVDARTIAGIAGFAPPTLHSLGARVANELSRHMFNLVVTNVPGPQEPLYLHGSRMESTYPVIPLARGQALSIGLTSYRGRMHFGLYGDREAMSDLDVLGQCLIDSLAETLEAAR
ncbi:MAG: wax ester/triacylglycerol synthase family O-acyltransferase [Kineosporiaceae bacterium]|nr:wax ester/triacylglycerol synthase family O-acyltransferase [Kineosporiaceae bacterium]